MISYTSVLDMISHMHDIIYDIIMYISDMAYDILYI